MLPVVNSDLLAAAGLNADLLAKLAQYQPGAADPKNAAALQAVSSISAPSVQPSTQLTGFMDWLQQYANTGAVAAPLVSVPHPLPFAPGRSTSVDMTRGDSISQDHDPEDVKELVHKVQRRLHQNRESARKCRQRKKAYLQDLEEELNTLRRKYDELKAAKVTHVAPSANTSRAGAEAIGALLSWQQEWETSLARVRRLINAAATDEQLEAALGHCADIMHRRKALVCDLVRKDVFAVMAGDHVSPEQRITLWMGGARPSHSLHLITQRLKDVHPNFEHSEALARVHAAWQQMEEAQSSGFESTKQQILTTLEAATGPDGTATPQMLGKLDALRIMLDRAEDLRWDCFKELSSVLPIREFAEAITTPLIAIERLRALHEACMSGR